MEILIENEKIKVTEIYEESIDGVAYIFLKGYKPDFYYKVVYYSEEFGDVHGIGDSFQYENENIPNDLKEKYMKSAIEDFSFWLSIQIEERNFFDQFEEHY